jgi:hypothetical protein
LSDPTWVNGSAFTALGWLDEYKRIDRLFRSTLEDR